PAHAFRTPHLCWSRCAGYETGVRRVGGGGSGRGWRGGGGGYLRDGFRRDSSDRRPVSPPPADPLLPPAASAISLLCAISFGVTRWCTQVSLRITPGLRTNGYRSPLPMLRFSALSA